ncbi:hypothetical protein H4219_004417 [Mycoemilia scoparia]|uniref:Uncharacterized protein n=1 Tax=Mycoemilia scoparia TaxID=417184 RepID=A0A9W8DRE8_9FUNG|nr:hypothetical protein H4219_004417 [Mycoemilia scoparia]
MLKVQTTPKLLVMTFSQATITLHQTSQTPPPPQCSKKQFLCLLLSLDESIISWSRTGQANEIKEILTNPKTKESFNINHADGVGNTAIHYAVQMGNIDCLRLLAPVKGLSINRRNNIDGDTPLHKAVKYEADPLLALEMTKVLIKYGGDTRIENNYQQLPIHIAPKTNPELRKYILLATATLNTPKSLLVSNESSDEEDGGSDSE